MRRFFAVVVCAAIVATGVAAAQTSGPLFASSPDDTYRTCREVVMIRRAFESYGFDVGFTNPDPFVDDAPAWCTDARAWAAERGVIKGVGWGSPDPLG